MKPRYTLLFLISLYVVGKSFAQDKLPDIMPMKDGTVLYTGVVSIEGVDKAGLFERANRWLATTYKSANDVIQLADKNAGTLIAKGAISTPWKFNGTMKMAGYLNHTLTIDVKDGKYRYELTDFIVRAIPPSGTTWPRDTWTMEQFMERTMQKKNSLRYAEFADSEIKSLLAGLEKAMNTSKPDF